MTDFRDLQIYFDESSTDGFFDLRIGDNDFAIDETMTTADLISEFSDRRVDQDNARDGYRGGWWATKIMGIDPKTWGSKRWTLLNKRLDKDTIRLWEQYTEDSYQWQIDAGFLVEVSCVAKIAGTNRLEYTVIKTYPDTNTSKAQRSVLWEGTR